MPIDIKDDVKKIKKEQKKQKIVVQSPFLKTKNFIDNSMEDLRVSQDRTQFDIVIDPQSKPYSSI